MSTTEPYIFYGEILPHRGSFLSFATDMRIGESEEGFTAIVHIQIQLNHVVATVETDDPWELFHLRNTVASVVETVIAVACYIHGFAYSFDLVRVMNRGLDLDLIFSTGLVCIVEPRADVDTFSRMKEVGALCSGPFGKLVSRAFRDLASAIANRDDTAFYCYRAIEALSQHCGGINNIDARNKQWDLFREVSKTERSTIDYIKTFADALRHGGNCALTDQEATRVIMSAWAVVDRYIATFTSAKE